MGSIIWSKGITLPSFNPKAAPLLTNIPIIEVVSYLIIAAPDKPRKPTSIASNKSLFGDGYTTVFVAAKVEFVTHFPFWS